MIDDTRCLHRPERKEVRAGLIGHAEIGEHGNFEEAEQLLLEGYNGLRAAKGVLM
jgi:hypothetical protein